MIAAARLAIDGTVIAVSVPQSNDLESIDPEANDPIVHSCLVEIELYRAALTTVAEHEPPQIFHPNYSRGDLVNQKEQP